MDRTFPETYTPKRLYLWACRRLYNELASAYDPVSWLVSLGRWAEWRAVALDYVVGPRVLEVGFGTGELLVSMAGRGLQVYGLDPSPAMQRIAAGKLRRGRLPILRVQGTVQAMPFPDGWFDCIVCTFPGEFILKPAAHRELARLLRDPEPDTGLPGGRLVVVGMCLDVDNALLRGALELLYGASLEDYLDRCVAAATAAGLSVTTHGRGGGSVRVSVIVAEKGGTG